MRYLILLLVCAACSLPRTTARIAPEKAHYEKSVAGYTGAKQVQFFIQGTGDTTLSIDKVVINGEVVPYSVQYTTGRFYLTATQTYRNPARDSSSTLTEEEFNTALLFQSQDFEALLYYREGKSNEKSLIIQEWTEKDPVLRP